MFHVEAVDQISKVALDINENIRQHENFQKMLSIQNSFCREGAPKLLAPGKFKLHMIIVKFFPNTFRTKYQMHILYFSIRPCLSQGRYLIKGKFCTVFRSQMGSKLFLKLRASNNCTDIQCLIFATA